MKKTLQPIVHRDFYNGPFEAELIAYLRDTIYRPLFDILDRNGIQRINSDVDDWAPFPDQWGGLGVPRANMPQIHGRDREGLVKFLARVGIPHFRTWQFPRELKPTQAEYSPEKIERARDHSGPNRPIIASQDHHIADGHHQWFASLLDKPTDAIEVLEFQAPIRQVIMWMNKFPRATRENADEPVRTALWAALLAGTVWYIGGRFIGAFDSKISKGLRSIGAAKVAGGFALAAEKIPLVIRSALATARIRSDLAQKQILDTLAGIETNITSAPTGLNFAKEVDSVVRDLQKQFTDTVSKVAGLEVPKTPGLEQTLSEGLTSGADFAIKNFALSTTAELRAKVQQHILSGGRAQQLSSLIESQYGVGKRRAAFIADSEVSLLTAAFREQRYKAIGSTTYEWRTQGDSRVRPTHGESNNHRILNGRVFSWSSPPVVDAATGRRRHPGQDYGPCRCLALPILNLP